MKFRSTNTKAAKLTAEQVYDMRQRNLAGESYPSLGKAFRIGTNQVGRICRGEAWMDVAMPVDAKSLDDAAAASLAKLMREMGMEPPPSTNALDRLNSAVAAKRAKAEKVDSMLDELINHEAKKET